MIRSIRNKPGLIIRIIVFSLTLFLYLILYGPLINRIRLETAESKALQTELRQTRKLISPLKGGTVKKSVTGEKGVALALNELTRNGLSKGIKFISITPKQQEASRDARYKIAPIEMEIESSYEGLGAFLGSLNRSQTTLITVRSLSILPDDKNQSGLETHLTLNAYISEGEYNE